ncbi:MAG: hypothetical protein E7641_00500 [Ruminococcaceae bacterium]|nr:hypothetical protein [Oscillospiraceae bacterium]
MKEYILGVILLSLVCSLFELVAPEGTGGGIKKHIRLVASLCVFCFSIAPLYGFICELGESEMFEYSGDDEAENVYEEIYNKNLSLETEESVEDGCLDILTSEFDLGEEDIDVEIVLSKELLVEYAALVIHPSAISRDPHPIADRLSELLEIECRIIYK